MAKPFLPYFNPIFLGFSPHRGHTYGGIKASTDDVVLLEVFAASSKFAELAGNYTQFLLQNMSVVYCNCRCSSLRLTIRCAAWNLRAQMHSICPKGLTFWHQKYTLIFPNPSPLDPNLSVFQRNIKRDL